MFPDRIRRVEEQVARELALILDQEVKDPRIGMVTVAQVRVTRDLRQADVHVSRLGDDPQSDRQCLKALEQARGFIRRLLGERIVLKFLPDLRFHLDTSVREAIAMEKIFRRIHEQEADKPGPDEPETEAN